MPGAARDARAASTASGIEEVIAKRSPNVTTAHSMMASAGARHARPLEDALGRRQLELGPDVRDQLPELLRAAAGGVGAAEVAGALGGGGGHEPAPCAEVGGRTSPISFTEKARRHDRHSQAPCWASCWVSKGNRSSPPQ